MVNHSQAKFMRFEMNLRNLCSILSHSVKFIVPTFYTKVTEYLCSGWVFFSSDKFRLFNKPYLTEFFYIIQKVNCKGFKDCHFGQLGTINARYISRYYRVSRDLIRLINRSKLVERRLFAIIDLLQGTKYIFLYFIWRVGG